MALVYRRGDIASCDEEDEELAICDTNIRSMFVCSISIRRRKYEASYIEPSVLQEFSKIQRSKAVLRRIEV